MPASLAHPEVGDTCYGILLPARQLLFLNKLLFPEQCLVLFTYFLLVAFFLSVLGP
jgi:hypothetical protein